MKILFGHKDGGPDSHVRCWGIESKRFGSALLLRFTPTTREVAHSHAFNCWNWVLRGVLVEAFQYGGEPRRVCYFRALRPFLITRQRVHQTWSATPATWIFSLRGPWVRTWTEMDNNGTVVRLTHGRKPVTT